ncbi:MAG TPA: hypothetical protein V6D02_09920 [Candidatus Obscuribacterales bacterium]
MGQQAWRRGGALLGISLGASLTVGWLGLGTAIAHTPATTPPLDAPADAVPELPPFTGYTLPQTFAISIPDGWWVTGSEQTASAVITSYAPEAAAIAPTDVKTEVILVPEAPDTYVARQIDDLIAGDYVIDRYGLAAVKGNEAFRLWIIEQPGDFAQRVITFVGYDNGTTAQIVSYYNDESPTTIETILAIHRSFELVSAAE